MKIKWLKNCEIEVCRTRDKQYSLTKEKRNIGDNEDVEIIGYSDTDASFFIDIRHPQLKLKDGGSTLTIDRESFEIIEK